MRGHEPQDCDLRALEPGSDCLATVDADTVVVETARGDVDLRKQVCQWALTRVFWGGGALEVCDHRLLEDGSERSDALVSDAIEPETARDGRGQ